MRILKPRAIGALKRLVDGGDRYYCCFCALGFFALADTTRLDTEQNLWANVPKLLGQMPLEECLPKPRGEVLVVGECIPPGGTPATQVEVRLRIGTVDKVLVVTGRRRWQRAPDHFQRLLGRGWVASEPEPFSSMPVDWAHAFGGKEFDRNPVGKGYVDPDSGTDPEGLELPNVEYPSQMVADPISLPEPASFWPIPPHWPQRAELLGPVDSQWLAQRFPALPEGTDPGIYNIAPVDQQIQGHWEGDEEFELIGMSPEGPVRGRLPGLKVRSFLEVEGGAWEELPMALDTVWFFPGLGRMVCVWRGVKALKSWNAAEIAWWVIGVERMGELSRTLQDYAEALARRRRKGSLWRLRDDDLLPPEGIEMADGPLSFSGPPPRQGPWTKSLAVRADRAHQRAQQIYSNASKPLAKVAEVLKRMEARGVKVPELPQLKPLPAPPPTPEVPPPPRVSSPAELAALGEYLENVLPRLRAKARELAKPPEVPSAEELQSRLEEIRSRVMSKVEEIGERTGLKDKIAETMKASEQQATGFVSRAPQEITKRLEELSARLPKDHPAAGRLEKLKPRLEKALKRWPQQDRDEPPPAPRASKRWGLHLVPAGEPATAEEVAQALERAARGESLAGVKLVGAVLKGAKLAGVNLEGADLTDADLSGADLSGANLARASLARARLTGAKLCGADLTGACLGKAEASGADFSGAKLVKSDLWEAGLEEAVLREAVVEGVLAKAARLVGADMCRARVKGGIWTEVKLDQLKAGGSQWERVAITKASLAGASFAGAALTKFTLAEVEARGVDFSGARMERFRAVMGSSLEGARFVGARCRGVYMHGAQLAGADLSQAEMDGAELGEAKMQGVRAWRTSMRGALLIGADLSGAECSGANFMGAQMMHAKVENAKFLYCNLYGANLLRVEMEGAHVEGCLLGRTIVEARGERSQA